MRNQTAEQRTCKQRLIGGADAKPKTKQGPKGDQTYPNLTTKGIRTTRDLSRKSQRNAGRQAGKLHKQQNREKTEALNKQRRHRGLDTAVSRETGEDTKTVNGMKSNSKSDMILTK